MDLQTFGWTTDLERHFEPYAQEGFVTGRVAVSFGSICTVWAEAGEVMANVAGRLRPEARDINDTTSLSGLPAVGDWVVMRMPDNARDAALIHAILPRRSAFSRMEPGTRTKQQVIAANVDTIFVMTSLNRDFNPRRLERYLTIVRENGSKAIVVLSKCDLVTPENLAEFLAQAEAVSPNVPVHTVCAITRHGTQQLLDYVPQGTTGALLGSSGVGKSTLINCWRDNEALKTAPIRNDDRGRHTTTNRELIMLANGGLIIDTPGMRELQLWDGAEGLTETFQDIESLSVGCRFSDCRHENEPGCAVREAIENGGLDIVRVDSYLKLRAELASTDKRRTELGRRERKQHERVACNAQRPFRRKSR